jgi:hypothetical protein
MLNVVTPSKDWLDILLQVLALVLLILITWLIRTYVKGSKSKKDITAIVRLSNSAIYLVENIDSRGDLKLPPGVSKGFFKLQTATHWLVDELARSGIKMTDEEAKSWISSEFQKRAGDVRPVKDIAEVTKSAVDLILQLEQSGAIQIPAGADRITYLAGLATDWTLTHLPANWTNISRDEAMTWGRAELLQRMPSQPVAAAPSQPVATAPSQPSRSTLSPAEQLSQLANSAVAFVGQLKASGPLTVKPGASETSVDADLALAWLLMEATRQGMTVTTDQLAQALATALQRKTAPA